MLVHEVAGIAFMIVMGAIIISALNKNSDTANVLGTSFRGFAQDIQVMQGQTAGTPIQ